MKNSQKKTNRNKSHNNKIFNKNLSTNKSVSLSNKNTYKNKNKSKNLSTYSITNPINKKIKPTKIKDNYLQKDLLENNNNYYKEFFNNYQDNENKDINNIGNCLNSKNNFYNSNVKLNDEYIENSIIFKKTLDRLLLTSNNLIEKQNNILNECDILAKNVAANDYSIQNIYENEKKCNFPNVMNDYTNNFTSILSQVKKNKNNLQINEDLKKENTLLKNQLDILNIDKEDNIKLKDDEIYTLKIILVTEINHIINFLNEIGYNNIDNNKMEISDITSQKLSNFFELITKIIKQMNELILKQENIISKLNIEKKISTDNKNENNNNNNKSYDKLSFDYNNYNLGLNNYNLSVNNNNKKNKYNISFRNYSNKKFYNNFDIIPNNYNIIELKNDNNVESKSNLNINNYDELINNDYKKDLSTNKKENEIKDQINDIEIINDTKKMSNSFFYNKEKQENNYSYDQDNNNNNYQTGSFLLHENINNKNDKQEIINSNINNDIIN